MLLKLFGRWALSAEGTVKDGWRWVFAGPVHLLAALLVLSIGGNVWLWRSRSDCKTTVGEIHAAQKQAGADQAAVNHEPARVSAEIVRKSNAEAPAYYDSVRVAADANRVRAAACPIGATDLPGADPAQPGLHGPDPAADMVSRPKADDDLLVAAAGRAAEMHAEALELIAAGVAVVAPEEPAGRESGSQPGAGSGGAP